MSDHRYKGGTAPFSFESIRLDWHDFDRERKVPVKVYFPKPLPENCPVILFSHCLGGSREGYGFLVRFWTTHGYICVLPQHAGSDEGIWQHAPAGHVMQALRVAAKEPANALARIGDIAFVLSQLERLTEDEFPWAASIDTSVMGLAGHSFGAMTTLSIAGHGFADFQEPPNPDVRFKAALAMSSPIPRHEETRKREFGLVSIPCLHMSGTEDVIPISDTRAEERRAPFDFARLAPSYFVNFEGGDHMVFAGITRNSARRESDEFFHKVIQDSSLALWDAYLKQDAAALEWLEQGGVATLLGDRGRFEINIPAVIEAKN